MKCVFAIIRINKMNQTKKALLDAGITSMTATGNVSGRGKGLWDAKVLEGARQNKPEAIELLGKEPPMRPQRIIQVIVPEKMVKKVVEIITEANQTPAAGDGKIFVFPTTEAVNVRTGAYGDAVLDL
ncbi:P-II family nitrogen regulator [Marinilabilia rubra]|uniref:P-II family nitrogen regulator n=1 Tax=Marinilabilia rubra TaxID=2162893 RepID=A0A2U2BBX5_9BACT|nr:P-II family nitrogen regulator [Marinilabilia rubra]PWE00568.1 P-II family nitrogen regulator [Marinilabilia rubra]